MYLYFLKLWEPDWNLETQLCNQRSGWMSEKQNVSNVWRIQPNHVGIKVKPPLFSDRLDVAHLAWKNAPDTGAAMGWKARWQQPSLSTAASTGIFLQKSPKNYTFEMDRKEFDRRKPLTFPKINLKGQQVGLNLVAHQVLQGDQELHRLLQRILRLKKRLMHDCRARTTLHIKKTARPNLG